MRREVVVIAAQAARIADFFPDLETSEQPAGFSQKAFLLPKRLQRPLQLQTTTMMMLTSSSQAEGASRALVPAAPFLAAVAAAVVDTAAQVTASAEHWRTYTWQLVQTSLKAQKTQ